MKNLSPIWFIKSPIDAEHKYYILLDFLKSVNLEIKEKKICSPTKKVFSLIEDLNHFLNSGSILGGKGEIKREEEILVASFTPEELLEIDQIAKNSLKILYKYADLTIRIRKNIEERIKIFNLGGSVIEWDRGITIFRNMSTEEIFSYWWKKTEMRIGELKKEGVILKRVPILNNRYSMSYEFIAHETLDSMGIRNGSSFPCTIIEISEDFNLNSEIFKIAKEKFIKEINPED